MDKQERKTFENPRSNANILSIITFAWLGKFFLKGYHKELTESDLPTPINEHLARTISKNVKKCWDKAEIACQKKGQIKPSLFQVLWSCFGNKILIWGFVQFIIEIFIKILRPLILGKVLSYFNEKSGISANETCYWIAVLFVNLIIFTFLDVQASYQLQLLGMQIRIASTSLIYEKILQLPRTSVESETTIGQIVNLLGNDVKSFDLSLFYAHYVWISPIQSFTIAYILYQQIGIAAVIGIPIFFFPLPFQGYLGKILPNLTLKAALNTDERLRLINEMISGVQVIKMFCWEKSFLKFVDNVRAKEMKSIRIAQLTKFLSLSYDMFTARISLFISLLLCVIFQNNLTTESVFTLFLYYNILKANMNTVFPLGLLRGAICMASMKRIQKFLYYESINFQSISTENGKENCFKLSASTASVEAISLENASARWLSTSKDDTLSNISLSVKSGSLVAIVGPVASGKTSLLHLILRELPLVKGNINVHGQISYVSQDPWIFNSSIRQNIIFTKPMDKNRYNEVVKVCQLERDFSLFTHKDQTLIGEKGINLSGGQRARIALARAVYVDADIYLLDDPLSAVDARVGRLIFDECICKFLKNKTRVLVTHQLQYLKDVDYVYIVNDGTVREEGTYQDLQAANISIKGYKALQEENSDTGTPDNQATNCTYVNHFQDAELMSNDEQEELAELRTIGKISKTLYFSYFTAARSLCLVFLVFLLTIGRQLASTGIDYYVSLWAEAQQFCSSNTTKYSYMCGETLEENSLFISVYGSLLVLLVVLIYTSIFGFNYMCSRSSQNLHSSMFYNIVRGKMSFFYNNSSGRILNRFSKDIGVIDNFLPISIYFTSKLWLHTLVVIGMTISLNYWLLIPTVVTAVISYFIIGVYLRTSCSIKRLDGITQSSLIRYVTDTIQGLTSVRAFGAQCVLFEEFRNYQDLHTSCLFFLLGCVHFLRLHVELTTEIYVGIVSYTFLLLNQHNSISGVGLIITQIIILADYFAFGMIHTTETETQMISVERVLEYSKIEQEPNLESTSDKPPEKWPTEGFVEFKNIHLRYNPMGEDVLKNISFVINPKEKIGIVGRTGAGKSSLIAALFRMFHLEGEIYIDGVPTSTLGLHDLRSKISIIPQAPVLFAGTLRMNLDPFEEVSDSVLWQVLDEVELKDAVIDMNGLDSYVSGGGSNFSTGQRQLLCLARAIVKNNRILVLDEATAYIDVETDSLIQKTIRKRFENCTVFIIAHRLNTIMDCDRIMVLDAGQILEFDQPFALLEKKYGPFYNMIQETGPKNANKLMEMVQSTRL